MSQRSRELNELVDVATRGFREFRRPYVADPDELLWKGPWLQVGYDVNGEVLSSRAGHRLSGEEFSSAAALAGSAQD